MAKRRLLIEKIGFAEKEVFLDYVDYHTFKTTKHKFDIFYYMLAENIKDFVKDKYEAIGNPIDGRGCVTTVIADIAKKDVKKLIFGFMRNRKNGETIAEKYRITIEKISDA